MNRMILAAVAALVPVAAIADDGLTIRDAYARSANPQTAAAFMVIENHRGTECRLIGASSDAARIVELHTHVESDGVMKMQTVEDGFAIPAGGDHALARGGDHVMMMGLNQPLANGDTVPLTLDFGNCGTLQVDAPVDNERMDDMTHAHMGH